MKAKGPTWKEQRGEVLHVKEVFPTIQGEGPLAGEPCVFVRLAGCNLKCWFCDTDFEDGISYQVGQLIDEIKSLTRVERPLVVVTGGEPLAQPISLWLTTMLGLRWRVQIETAGTLYPADLPEHESLDIVCSPKTAKVHPMLRRRVTAWKYLIRATDDYDGVDGLPISQTQDKKKAGGQKPLGQKASVMAPPTPNTPVYLQPVEETDPKLTKANTDAAIQRCLSYGYRLSIQQHKILGLR